MSAVNLSSKWKGKSEAYGFLIKFIGLILVFYVLYWSSFYSNHINGVVTAFQAKAGSLLINLLGMGVQAVDDQVVGEAFSMNVEKGCDGIEVTAVLIAGILADKASLVYKLKGIILGVLLIGVLNLLRFPILYLVGKNGYEGLFDFIHVQGGFFLFISAALLFWINWGRKLEKQSDNSNSADDEV